MGLDLNTPVRNALEIYPRKAKRPQRRPKMTRIQTIRQDLNNTEIKLDLSKPGKIFNELLELTNH